MARTLYVDSVNTMAVPAHPLLEGTDRIMVGAEDRPTALIPPGRRARVIPVITKYGNGSVVYSAALPKLGALSRSSFSASSPSVGRGWK